MHLGYLAYVLRLWQVTDGGNSVWRASVESPHSGERHGFANLGLLFAFLEEKTGASVHGAAGWGLHEPDPTTNQTLRVSENP